ncbi:RL352 [Hepatospora eriocheir]|uniref:RL352 n=1 Tax=Hepatospora eriocheir TaxID=1081669 RepID=A0A1X0QKA5_9MICR|nr:RL352 [Hepatospora eriocheir]
MVQASELRKMNSEELKEHVKEQLYEKQNFLQQKHSKKVQPFDIRRVRKEITRTKQIQYEKKLEEFVEQYKTSKFIPKELRRKLNKAKRLALTDEQKNKMSRTMRYQKMKYPKKVYSFNPLK